MPTSRLNATNEQQMGPAGYAKGRDEGSDSCDVQYLTRRLALTRRFANQESRGGRPLVRNQ